MTTPLERFPHKARTVIPWMGDDGTFAKGTLLVAYIYHNTKYPQVQRWILFFREQKKQADPHREGRVTCLSQSVLICFFDLFHLFFISVFRVDKHTIRTFTQVALEFITERFLSFIVEDDR